MSVRSWWLMISVGLGILLNPLNSSMVSVAIPSLQNVFQLDFTGVSWIIFSFYIASSIAQPIMGKASDLFGRRKMFLIGLVVAFIASLLAPLSPTFGWLIVFRIVQSIGTSMMVGVGMAIVRIHITEKQATALSVLSIFLSGAAAIGPFIGGVLVHWWNWPAIFFINIPFVVASFLLAWRTIPKDESPTSVARNMSFRKWFDLIDARGILLFTLGLVALLVGLLSAKSSGHISLENVIVGLIGLVALGAFVRYELKATSPFIPLRTFAKYPALTWVNVEFMFVNVLYYSLFFGLPSYLQVVRHVSEFQTGILMLSLGLCSLAASPIAGRWIDKSGPRPALLVSAILMTLGSVWLVTLNPTSPVISVCLALAAFGISNGLNNVGMQAALFQSSPKEIIGVASGLFNTSRYLGTIFSSLLIGIVMGGKFSFEGFQVLGIVLTVIALTLVFMSRRRLDSGQLRES
ncbi:MFS transporter [Paenibacillus jamilae]|uniref:MFS transporter n=2 Tax=Paenibacillus TaxID=44249 RepID=E3EJJ0_PAEPS|nr:MULTISPECIES: MFS transporter [Paenibacillus]ADO56540.1 MFS transporter [Paenibacillus polymyxa SC2]AUO08834.1 MFS transporter [Paenibacillus sp. lzh-N1]AZH29474.1 MFS transporter [Paenibacillus sp. M-152]KTS79693.1 MFS transporter [Paenibacillus jamilae]OAZ46790.1 MFS transporter [Paenibacillus polymyxa]